MKESRFLIKTPNPDKPSGFDYDYIDGAIEYLDKLLVLPVTSEGYRWNGSSWVFDRTGYTSVKRNKKGKSVRRG